VKIRPEGEEGRRGVQPSRVASIHRPEQEHDEQEERVRDQLGTDGGEERHEEVNEHHHDDAGPLGGNALTAQHAVYDAEQDEPDRHLEHH
jgi:hypothetical protein